MGDAEDKAHFRFKGMKKEGNDSREERVRQSEERNRGEDCSRGEKNAVEERRMGCSRGEKNGV